VARSVVNILEDKKGENIVLLDVHELSSFTDYFVFANGTSDRMLDALAKTISENIDKQFGINGKVEGSSQVGWMVVDLGDTVVHLFTPQQRDYYRLEELWSKGKTLLRLQ
jgi:ribosome-associated protein